MDVFAPDIKLELAAAEHLNPVLFTVIERIEQRPH
jgi:hypothetical protein